MNVLLTHQPLIPYLNLLFSVGAEPPHLLQRSLFLLLDVIYNRCSHSLLIFLDDIILDFRLHFLFHRVYLKVSIDTLHLLTCIPHFGIPLGPS